jgi:hypothetical protein
MKDSRAGHSGLTEQPILNEINAIVAEGAEKGSKAIVYSSEELARKLLTPWRKSGRVQRRTSGSGLTVSWNWANIVSLWPNWRRHTIPAYRTLMQKDDKAQAHENDAETELEMPVTAATNQ